MIQHTEELGHPLLEGPNSIPPAAEQPTPGEHHQSDTVCITYESDHPHLWAFTFTLSPFIVLAWLANSFFSRIIWVSALSRSPIHSCPITHFWKTIFLLLNWRNEPTRVCPAPAPVSVACPSFPLGSGITVLPSCRLCPSSHGFQTRALRRISIKLSSVWSIFPSLLISIHMLRSLHPYPEKTLLHSAQCSTWPSLSSFSGKTSPGLSSPALWRWLTYFSASCHPSCHSNSTTWLKLFPPCWSMTL